MHDFKNKESRFSDLLGYDDNDSFRSIHTYEHLNLKELFKDEEDLSYEEKEKIKEQKRLAKIFSREEFNQMEIGKTVLYDEEGTEYVFLGLQSKSDHWPVFVKRKRDGFISEWYREKFIKGYKKD